MATSGDLTHSRGMISKVRVTLEGILIKMEDTVRCQRKEQKHSFPQAMQRETFVRLGARHGGVDMDRYRHIPPLAPPPR